VDQPIVRSYVSPLGTYVLTWHYPPRSRPGEPEPLKESWDNLVVWDARTGAVVWRTQVKVRAMFDRGVVNEESG
jgi:uncharacterized protein with WD repeat